MDLIKAATLAAKVAPAKPLMPVWSCALIADGRIQTTNGIVTVSLPVDIQWEGVLDARRFAMGVKAAGEEAKITSGKTYATVSGHGFRTRIQTLPIADFPDVDLEFNREASSFIDMLALSTVLPFASRDSVNWDGGVLFRNGYAVATDHSALGFAASGFPVDLDAVVHANGLSAIFSFGNVIAALVDDRKIMFEYDSGMLASVAQLNTTWPDVSKFMEERELPPVAEGLLDAVTRIMPLANGEPIKFSAEGISTGTIEQETNSAFVGLPDALFDAATLSRSIAVADHFDFWAYPEACYFSGPVVRGALMGLRV